MNDEEIASLTSELCKEITKKYENTLRPDDHYHIGYFLGMVGRLTKGDKS